MIVQKNPSPSQSFRSLGGAQSLGTFSINDLSQSAKGPGVNLGDRAVCIVLYACTRAFNDLFVSLVARCGGVFRCHLPLNPWENKWNVGT